MGRFLERWIAWLILLVLGGWLAASAGTATEPQSGDSDGRYVAGGKSNGSAPSADKTDPKRKKQVDAVFFRLGSMRPSPDPRKDLNDYFIIGTAELNLATKHADVRFEVKQGQQAAAEFLVDYVAAPPANAVRQWQGFSRVKDAQQADAAVAQLRMQYDQAVAYQEHLKQRQEHLQRLYADLLRAAATSCRSCVCR